jgi:cbb3-type cytochrome oxidase maturation protein
MEVLLFLIPIAILIATVGIFALIWAVTNHQYDDLKGASERILLDDED